MIEHELIMQGPIFQFYHPPIFQLIVPSHYSENHQSMVAYSSVAIFLRSNRHDLQPIEVDGKQKAIAFALASPGDVGLV